MRYKIKFYFFVMALFNFLLIVALLAVTVAAKFGYYTPTQGEIKYTQAFLLINQIALFAILFADFVIEPLFQWFMDL